MRALAACAMLGFAACVTEPPPIDDGAAPAAKPPPSDVAVAPGPVIGDVAAYIVRDEDTLAGIADYVETPWPVLAQLNGLRDPDHIEAGQGLIVPIGDLEARGIDPVRDLGLVPYTRPQLVQEAPAPCDVRWRELTPSDGPVPRGYTDGEGGEVWSDGGAGEWGLDQRRCAPVRGGRLCSAIEGAIWIERDGGGRRILRQDGGAMNGELRVAELDLDRDGDDELVIADWVGTSNGIALMYYDVLVLEDIDASPISFTTVGWGSNELFVDLSGQEEYDENAPPPPSSDYSMIAGAGGCELFAIRFQSIDDPIAGDGNYDVGRRLAYRDSELHVVPEGFLARRYRERAPVELRADDPVLDEPVQASVRGVITAADRDGITVEVDGEAHLLVWSIYEYDDPGTLIGAIGWRGEPGVLPPDYRPADAAHWIGHAVTVEHRAPFRMLVEDPDADVEADFWSAPIVWIDP